MAIAQQELAACGLRAKEVSPFSDRWMSLLDPERAKMQLGFRHESLESYLEKIVANFLNRLPAEPPANYAARPLEIQAAERLQ